VHEHGPGSWLAVGLVLALPGVLATGGYLAGVIGERRRGRPWPVRRTAAWSAGIAVLLAASLLAGPLAAGPLAAGPLAGPARPPGDGLAVHMIVHLLVGMLAPLLLVLSAPVTLALRSLAIVPARRVARILRSRPVAVLTHPVVAAALNLAPLWWLIQPETIGQMQSNALLHAVVLTHFLIAGYLFTASIVGVDPSPHRASFRLRAVVLVGSIAAHGILAKLLVARAPVDASFAELESAARVMYTGGDVLELALVTVFCLQWYRSARPQVRAAAATAVS
jgi:putative membrane protein